MFSVTLPNLHNTHITPEFLKNKVEELGIEYMQHLNLIDPDTGEPFLTPHRYAVLPATVYTLSQRLDTKSSIPDDNLHVDEMTGQVTGVSKGARISFPEFSILRAKGYEALIIEGMKVRGGDDAANRQFEQDIANYGIGNLNNAIAAGEGTKATSVMATYLRACLINTNLDNNEVSD